MKIIASGFIPNVGSFDIVELGIPAKEVTLYTTSAATVTICRTFGEGIRSEIPNNSKV